MADNPITEAKELWDELTLKERQELINQGINYLDYFKENKLSKISTESKKSKFVNKLDKLTDAGVIGLRKSRNLFHLKQNKVITQSSIPSSNQGANGDLRLVGGSGGVSLYGKFDGAWYSIGGGGGVSAGGDSSTAYSTGGGGEDTTSTVRGGASRARDFRASVSNDRLAIRGLGTKHVFSAENRIGYDSGWVTATKSSNVVFTHNLSLTDPPEHLAVWASDDVTPRLGVDTLVRVDYSDSDAGVFVTLTTANTLTVHIGDKLYQGNSFGASRPSDIDSGFIRVIIRK